MIEHAFPQIPDAWAIPLDEFTSRIDALNQINVWKRGGDLQKYRHHREDD